MPEIVQINENQIDDKTRLYRYLNPEAFKRFLASGVGLTRMNSWPDRFELAGFEFFKEFPAYQDARSLKNFFTSCWTFDQIKIGEIDEKFSTEAANKELRADGSAAMWEAYCPEGGVRICTTVAKLTSFFENSDIDCQVVHCGPVEYCAAKDTFRTDFNSPIEETFFYKRIGYRHEVEYRFIAYLENENGNWVNLQLKNHLDFLEEILVFPMKNKEKNKLANTLHQTGVAIATHPSSGANSKNNSIFCRMSQLYGLVSGEIGNAGFID